MSTGINWLTSLMLLFIIGCGQALAAGETITPLTIYAELLGNGGAYSLNVDYRFKRTGSVRVGYVAWHAAGIFGTHEELTAMPVLVNYLAGRGNHLLELGAGVLVGHYRSENSLGETDDNYGFTTLTGSVSYRYQRPEGGAFFKAGVTPFYSWAGEDKAYPEEGLFPWFGIAWGYSF